MSITRKDMEAAAAKLIRREVEDFEPFTIFESEAFDRYTEDEREQLVDLVTSADVAITWKDSE